MPVRVVFKKLRREISVPAQQSQSEGFGLMLKISTPYRKEKPEIAPAPRSAERASPVYSRTQHRAKPALCAFLNGQEILQIIIEQLADAINGQISRRVGCNDPRILRVVTLVCKHGGDPFLPDVFNGAEDVKLVVDDHIVIGGVTRGDICQLVLLMHIDEHMALDSFVQPGAFYF